MLSLKTLKEKVQISLAQKTQRLLKRAINFKPHHLEVISLNLPMPLIKISVKASKQKNQSK
jgi:hypothetical protein